MQHHRIIRLVIAFAIGIFLALYSFERISDPEPGMQRAREEAVVLSAREILKSYVSPDTEIEIVDPLATDRSVGKAYIYPTESGWEVSGHYRRYGADSWHPFLMLLDSNVQLVSLSVRDDSEKVIAAARENPKLSVTPDPRLGDDPEDHPDN
jgi:hypothetical protein